MRFALLLAAALLTVPLCAQTSQAPPVTPPQNNLPHDSPLNPKLPTVFIVGDSTARNGADLGWGDHFAIYFDTDRINVANRAIAGRSSRTYINEGHWDKVLTEMKPGDFVLLQMGHNDGGGDANSVAKDTKGRSSIHTLGEETVDVPIKTPFTSGPLAGLSTETVHTYGWYMRKYIADTRANGATPILLTVTIRNIWVDGAKPGSGKQIERDMGFRALDLQLANDTHTPLADMATLEADRLQALGPEKTAAYFPIDHTHSSAEAAALIAQDVVTSLRIASLPLTKYLR